MATNLQNFDAENADNLPEIEKQVNIYFKN